MQTLSPIIIFAFNRLDSLQATIKSLLSNKEASDSDLFVFVDGPRPHKQEDNEKVQLVRDFVQNIEGFKSITYYFSDINKGLAPSVIDGVTKIMRIYKRAIIVEDDLFVAPRFLQFMNLALDKFKDDKKIFQISGYCPKLKDRFVRSQDVFLNSRAQSWSWGTWVDRWDSIDWDVRDYGDLKSNKNLIAAFNKHGSDLFNMLRNYMEGKNSSWYVRFCYAMHKQNKYSLCPTRSLVRNDGFNGDGMHCNNYNRYKIVFDNRSHQEFNLPDIITPNKALQKDAIKYWSIPYRIYGKFMTFLFK